MTAEQITTTNPVSQKTRPLHLGYLDGIRALAAIYVVLHHSWLTTYFDGRHPNSTQAFWEGWLGYGHFAVDVFIVLSGFCLMIPVIRRGLVLEGGPNAFFRKRIRRILPPYYAALTFSLILATTILSAKTGTLWDSSLPVTRLGIIAHLLLLQNLHGAMEINSVLWSIAVECQIYLLFPTLIHCWKTFGVVRTAAVTITLGIIAGVLLQSTHWQGLTAHYVSLFTFGMLGATISFSADPAINRYRTIVPWRNIALALFIVIILCTRAGIVFGRNQLGIDVVVGLWAATLMVALNDNKMEWLNRILRWRPLAYIGTMSYSLYLVHLPLLQLIWQYVLKPTHFTNQEKFMCLTAAALTGVIFLSWLFHLVFERPFMTGAKASAASKLPKNTAVALSTVEEVRL